MFQMSTVFTITMAKMNYKTGNTIKNVLLAKNVDLSQAICELEGRTNAGDESVKTILSNMYDSVIMHGASFAIFYSNEDEDIEFYVAGNQQVG